MNFMQEDWDVIGQVMLQLVNDYFPVKELKNYMSEFITLKMDWSLSLWTTCYFALSDV